MNASASPMLAIDYAAICAAQTRIATRVQRTPALHSPLLDAHCGAQVFLKCENLQHSGAFKLRGAFNTLLQFSPAQRAAGVVAFSSGNHAQAIALAARELGMRAVIVMPNDAPPAKLAATRAYGGEVLLYDRYREDREAICRELARAQGLTLVPPYDHPQVMAGQGTLAKELFEQCGELDVLLSPLGGGGLLSGCAVAAQALSPACRVVGVEPAAGNDGQLSLQRGERVRIATPRTVADGAQTQQLGELTFAVIRRHVAEIRTVDDAALLDALRFAARQLKLVLEPTGCLGLAALLSQPDAWRGLRVGVVLSGGNVDPAQLAGYLAAA